MNGRRLPGSKWTALNDAPETNAAGQNPQRLQPAES